jgi:hypothetical protein
MILDEFGCEIRNIPDLPDGMDLALSYIGPELLECLQADYEMAERLAGSGLYGADGKRLPTRPAKLGSKLFRIPLEIKGASPC